MNILRVALMAGAVLFCAIFSHTQARPIAVINYQEEFNASDLVVVATPTAQTKDTQERSLILNIYRQDKDGKQVPVPSIGVATNFRVSVVLKGDKALKQFTLHHYRIADEGMPIVNGPMLFFYADPALSATGQQKRSSYFLFLIRESDGRYAPTWGQMDAGYLAIHPLPFEPNQADLVSVPNQ